MIFLKIARKLIRTFARISSPNTIRIFFFRILGVKIGDRVYIAEGINLVCCLGLERNLEIGDRVAIAPNVTIIITSDPNNSKLRHLKTIYDFIEIKGSVKIDNDAWIGANAIIMPNIIIGEGAVVGAGAVVTKNIPPYCVVAGNPARIITKMEI